MSRKLAALLGFVLAVLMAASLTVGILYWALEALRRPKKAPGRPAHLWSEPPAALSPEAKKYI